jgi:uncharacterized protein YbaR (Trm112 family)
MPHEVLKLLRCPEDRSPLAVADDALIARLNWAIRAGQVRNQAGRRLEKPINGGYVRTAGDLLYPIVDHIPVLLGDEAIALNDE